MIMTNTLTAAFASGLVQGLVATFVMDAFAIVLMKSGLIRVAPYGPVPRLLGRWVLGFRKFRFMHADLLNAESEPSEMRVGWIAHYVIGATLGCAFLALTAFGSIAPTAHLWSALVFGLSTCLLPWLLLFPAIGFGPFAHRVPIASRLLLSSFLNHLVFGCGLAIAGVLIGR